MDALKDLRMEFRKGILERMEDLNELLFVVIYFPFEIDLGNDE